MGLDIKFPIGLMFAIFGVILTIFGMVTSGNTMYAISLNTNINLLSGIFMLLFGGTMLIASWFTKKSKKEQA